MNALILVCLIGSLAPVLAFEQNCFGEGSGGQLNVRKIANGAEDFAMDFTYRVYGAIQGAGNRGSTPSFLTSPYSVWSVLNLAYLGADGNTARQLEGATKVSNKNEAFYGSRFIDRTLKSYVGSTVATLNKGYFDNSLNTYQCSKIHQYENVNFADAVKTAALINKEVNTTTFGKIPELLQPGDLQAAVFLLLNAIYFKGTWVNQFDPKNTENRPFHDEFGREVSSTPTMKTLAEFNYTDLTALGAKAIELPYDNSRISMIIILPDLPEGVGSNFDLVLRRVLFRNDKHDAMTVILNEMSTKRVHVFLPKFKMEYMMSEQLKSVMMQMGVSDLFTPQADLRHFAAGPLMASKMLQKSIIELNEEGTVAAASTALIGTRSGSRRQIVFNANRPFIYFIRDMKQGVTLFTGTYMNPADMAA